MTFCILVTKVKNVHEITTFTCHASVQNRCFMYVNAIFGGWRPGGATCVSGGRSGRAIEGGRGRRTAGAARARRSRRGRRGGAQAGAAQGVRAAGLFEGTFEGTFQRISTFTLGFSNLPVTDYFIKYY